MCNLIIFHLSEPYIVDIESYYEHGISFTYHIIPCAGTLSKIDSKGKTVIPSEYRKRDSQSYTHRIHIVSIQLVICLVIIYSSPIRTTFEEISDIVSVRYELESCPE
jgi:hypothetical protein